MAEYDVTIDESENEEQRTICCFVLDVSGSMAAGGKIKSLNNGIAQFQNDILADPNTSDKLEVAVVTFDSTAHVLRWPALLKPGQPLPVLSTGGSTALVDGVREAIKMVEARKVWYKTQGLPYLRPWIILITDGGPDPGQDVIGLGQEVNKGVDDKKFVILSLGVESADMGVLTRISHPSMPPLHLKGVNFAAFFRWLSASMSAVSNSAPNQTVVLQKPVDAGWADGFVVS